MRFWNFFPSWRERPAIPSLLSRLLGKKKKKKNADQSPLFDGENLEAVPRTQRVYPDLTLKPPGVISRVPDDIWRQIAQYIPEAELKGLLEINASLFHLAMDARYRSVILRDFHHAAQRKLRRLRDPAIAPRVRQLRVYMLNYPQWSHTIPADMRVLASALEPGPVENHDAGKCIACSEPEGIIKAMVDTICCFSNVVEFSVSWRDPGRAPYREEFLPFLTAAWRTFGPQLRKIDLGVSLGQLETLLCTSPGRLDALEELQIEIRCLATAHQNDVLATAAAPFINRAALNLKRLSIRFTGDPPYPSLLKSLQGEIPNLESLTLDMNFDSYGFSDDERGLTRILRNHAATLRHVRWRSHRSRDWSDLYNNPLIAWMMRNQSDGSILSNLRTLQIPVPAGLAAFGLTMGYIGRSADTLTSLVLAGAYLAGDQAKTMMSIFANRRRAPSGPYFRELSIGVLFLSPDVVSTLAQVFPCLDKLGLCTISVSGSEEDVIKPESRVEELAYARGFAEALKRLDIRGWQLRDIRLTTSCYTVGLDIKLMRVFAECVPSIKCFWGVDKELVPLETDNYHL